MGVRICPEVRVLVRFGLISPYLVTKRPKTYHDTVNNNFTDAVWEPASQLSLCHRTFYLLKNSHVNQITPDDRPIRETPEIHRAVFTFELLVQLNEVSHNSCCTDILQCISRPFVAKTSVDSIASIGKAQSCGERIAVVYIREVPGVGENFIVRVREKDILLGL